MDLGSNEDSNWKVTLFSLDLFFLLCNLLNAVNEISAAVQELSSPNSYRTMICISNSKF